MSPPVCPEFAGLGIGEAGRAAPLREGALVSGNACQEIGQVREQRHQRVVDRRFADAQGRAAADQQQHKAAAENSAEASRARALQRFAAERAGLTLHRTPQRAAA
ncbi:hypothetical protein AB0A77_37585 [Streptomyces varsoviensis]|uniref:hypothetical protein n=1 Tax=Streptomyces varsoviensis TaxID=67373 RepID=UPI0033E222D6